jgi:hypothetical protein
MEYPTTKRRFWCRQTDSCTPEMDECEPYARPKTKQAREELRARLLEQEFGEWRGCAEQDGRGQRHRNSRPEVGAVSNL